MEKVIGIGAGGFSKVLLDVLRHNKAIQIIGFLDADSSRWGADFHGYPIIGGDERISTLVSEGIYNAFIGVGSVGRTQLRARLYQQLKSAGLTIIPIIHPSVIIAQDTYIGDGPLIMARAIIQAGAHLGNNVVINTAAIIEHDCVLEDHVFIGPSVTFSGEVRVGAYTHIGTGAVIRQGIHIGSHSIIGMGAVITKDVPNNVVVVGNPAKILRENR